MPKRLLHYEEVLLPTGLRIRGVRPTVQELVRRGLWPKELRAQLFLGGSVASAEDDEATQKAYVESQHISIAGYIRYEQDTATGRWERVEYSPAEVHDFDPRDVDALEDIVLRRTTAAAVTAKTLEEQGAITAEERATVEEKEAGATVTGWSEFRADPGSVTPGSDSGDVADAAVGTATGGGRRARSRAGRGSRDQARAG